MYGCGSKISEAHKFLGRLRLQSPLAKVGLKIQGCLAHRLALCLVPTHDDS
jgi:hypothetical protein